VKREHVLCRGKAYHRRKPEICVSLKEVEMTIDTEELDYMVRNILDIYPEDKRWPINIIDKVFLVIEKSKYTHRLHYDHMIGNNDEHRQAVNQYIGKLVKQHTGLETIQESVPAKLSKLIKTYTELGQISNGND
jgi:hypothetical protein